MWISSHAEPYTQTQHDQKIPRYIEHFGLMLRWGVLGQAKIYFCLQNSLPQLADVDPQKNKILFYFIQCTQHNALSMCIPRSPLMSLATSLSQKFRIGQRIRQPMRSNLFDQQSIIAHQSRHRLHLHDNQSRTISL